jgi:drug/metabolite transporter (DMT)-like permease
MRALRILWALPNTLIGLALVPLALLSGGRIRLRDGALETHGRGIDWLLRRLVPIPGGARALTLGHVILGRDERCLRDCDAHERIHVRQYELWGPLFLPAYLAASVAAMLRGVDPYRGNRFECEARAKTVPGVDRSPRREEESPPPAVNGAGSPAAAPTPPAGEVSGAPRASIVFLAFAAIYLIWGSTYLAIRFAVETMPPFLMLAARFGVAGILLYAWLRLRGRSRPPAREWAGAAAVGGLLLVGGTGAVAWSEQWIASGLAALIVAVVPVWMVLLDWLRPAGRRPGPAVVAGLLLGIAGVALLVGPVDLSGGGRMQFLGSAAVVLGTISWATGSVHGSRFPLPRAPRMSAALQMTTGGLLLLLIGTLAGEWTRFDPAGFSSRSVLALVYLIVFGSLVAFAAYVFLLRETTPARVGSYAYVNPVVAVFLGWALADEPVTMRTLVAAAIILLGVALIVSRRASRRA